MDRLQARAGFGIPFGVAAQSTETDDCSIVT